MPGPPRTEEARTGNPLPFGTWGRILRDMLAPGCGPCSLTHFYGSLTHFFGSWKRLWKKRCPQTGTARPPSFGGRPSDSRERGLLWSPTWLFEGPACAQPLRSWEALSLGD